MEDTHIAKKIDIEDGGDEFGCLFCVFDGHGGKEVAQFAGERFVEIFKNVPAFKSKDYGKALEDSIYKLDEEIKNKEFGTDTGATACTLFVTKDEIACANAGDSRAVLYNGSVEPLSHDHKPDNVAEEARIKASGHFVEDSRVDGNLALSRAIGDFQYKDYKDGDYK